MTEPIVTLKAETGVYNMSNEAPAAVQDSVVRLTMGEVQPPYVSTCVLAPGMRVAYRDSQPVTYDGADVNAFVRAYADLCAPARVKIDQWQHGDQLQLTLRLLDG